MAVVIRMRRAGAKNRAFFHVVAADKRSPRDGKFIEKLGYYDPLQEPPTFQLDRDRLEHWLSQGASASPTVAQLIAKFPKPAEPVEGEQRADA